VKPSLPNDLARALTSGLQHLELIEPAPLRGTATRTGKTLMFRHLRLPITMNQAGLWLSGFRLHLSRNKRLMLKRRAAQLLLNRLA
ncbi:hypothetical protein, partial [Acidisphaera sp. S103]|uniref:hypothetical protein n=1 Tax=Acidisphaera sp. S103 TaxID=1747223 RepID=UPI0020B16EBE